MKKRLLKEGGGDVSTTIEHLEEYLDKLMEIGKNKGIFQDKSKKDKLNELGTKMMVSIKKMGEAIANYHPHHDDHDDHDDHDHNSHRKSTSYRGGYSGGENLPNNSSVKIKETDLQRIVKKILKEGGENINDVVDHIEEEMDNLQNVAMEKGLFVDNKIGGKMNKLYGDAMMSFQNIVKHIEDYHPKSDEKHKDIKNNKHSAPIASNNKVNEGVKIKNIGKVVKLTESDLQRIVKRVLTEEELPKPKMTLSGKEYALSYYLNQTKKSSFDKDGFYQVQYKDGGKITSVENYYEGGKEDSERNDFVDSKYASDNSIGFFFWKKIEPNNTGNLDFTLTNDDSGEIVAMSQEKKYGGKTIVSSEGTEYITSVLHTLCFVENIAQGNYTINNSIDNINKLKITVT